MTNPSVIDTHYALVVTTELKLISADNAKLVSEVLKRGFECSENPEKWALQIDVKLAELEYSLRQNLYHRYLKGGSRPTTSSGHNDWNAKDRYNEIQASIAEISAFGLRIKALGQVVGDVTKHGNALNTALSLTKILLEVQQTKADSNQLLMDPLRTDDIRLCLTWAGVDVITAQYVDVQYLIIALGDYEASRLLSARVAEHAAMKYYEALGHEVLDVSIGQIQNSDDLWKDHDLLVNGRPIDVKNARRSFSSYDFYVEHCVPKFKQSRASGEEVSITGVLSEYRMVQEPVETVNSCRILGEVTASKIRRLYVWARWRFGHILNIDGIWKPKYQPGWIFEYPPEHYPSRDAAIAGIPVLIRKLKASGIANDKIPGWLLTLCPDRELVSPLAGSGQRSRVLCDLQTLQDHIGFSRPGLFIYIMGLFLESIANGEQTGKLHGYVSELLFVPGSLYPRPLGLEDSQRYITNLIGMLVQVQNEALRQNIKFTAFRLTHPSVLRGQRESGAWMTLLAYCGGWRKVPVRARCGATPLFFGQHKVCQNCGHLICDDCGYCFQSCDLCQQHM